MKLGWFVSRTYGGIRSSVSDYDSVRTVQYMNGSTACNPRDNSGRPSQEPCKTTLVVWFILCLGVNFGFVRFWLASALGKQHDIRQAYSDRVILGGHSTASEYFAKVRKLKQLTDNLDYAHILRATAMLIRMSY
jgi:hypothetical protein